jgi:ABC-type microcin C transport system permease subunit YejE
MLATLVATVTMTERKGRVFGAYFVVQSLRHCIIFGMLMLAMAVIGTCTGKLPGRFGDVSYRTKDPKRYWSALAGYYLRSIGFIGYYLYNVHPFAN